MKIEMAKPTVNKIAPFDASVDKTFSFSWAGSQPYANRLIIYNADSMEPIYDRKIQTGKNGLRSFRHLMWMILRVNYLTNHTSRH